MPTRHPLAHVAVAGRPATTVSHGRRLAAFAAPLALVLALLTAAQPVLAEACVPTVAAFPPGHWVARGILIQTEDTDILSTMEIQATGGFDLTIDPDGIAHGTFSMVGDGLGDAWGSTDGSFARTSYIKTGQLSGSGMTVEIDGEMEVSIHGAVDSDPNHDGDQSNQTGRDLYGFGNSFVKPFQSQFSPSAANCNTVFGSLAGPAEYGTETTDQTYFLAYRVGSKPTDVDVQGQLAKLLEDAQFVLNMDPVDPEVLYGFVQDMLGFETLLASLEACDPGSELDMGGTWAMLQSVVLNTLHNFLDAAKYNYTTADVIRTLGIWLQGGSLGWRGSDCLEGGGAVEAGDVLDRFEDVLIDRYVAARDEGDTAEMRQIAIAAYQYGMETIMAMVEDR